MGTWKKLAYVELGSDASSIDTANDSSFSGDDFEGAESLLVICNIKDSGSNANVFFRFNNNSSSVYSSRRCENGGSDTSTGSDFVAADDLKFYQTGSGTDVQRYIKMNISNLDSHGTSSSGVKLCIAEVVESTATGSDTAPVRSEHVGKWEVQPTGSASNITRISCRTTSANYASGSSITVYGQADDTVSDEKDSLTNVPDNTRYEETDTRKIYRRTAEGTFTSTDYTTSNFTAVGSTVAITSNSAVSTSTPSNTANRVYATIPSLKSTDAWSCDFQLYVTADATNDYHTIAFCTNSDAFNTSGQSHISLQTQGGSYNRFVLNARIGGSNSETATSSSTRSLSTNYYCTLSSDGADTARIRIWTNSNRTGAPDQDKTLSIANIGTLTTVMHGTRNSGDTNVWSGTTSNVSLTNPAKWIERNTA